MYKYVNGYCIVLVVIIIQFEHFGNGYKINLMNYNNKLSFDFNKLKQIFENDTKPFNYTASIDYKSGPTDSMAFCICNSSDHQSVIYIKDVVQTHSIYRGNNSLVASIQTKSEYESGFNYILTIKDKIPNNSVWLILITEEDMDQCYSFMTGLSVKSVLFHCYTIDSLITSSNTNIKSFIENVIQNRVFNILIFIKNSQFIYQFFQQVYQLKLQNPYQFNVITKDCPKWQVESYLPITVVCQYKTKRDIESELSYRILGIVQKQLLSDASITMRNATSISYQNNLINSLGGLYRMEYFYCGKSGTFLETLSWNNNSTWSATPYNTSIYNQSCHNNNNKIELRICIALEDPFYFSREIVFHLNDISIYQVSNNTGYIVELLSFMERKTNLKFKIYFSSNFHICLAELQKKKVEIVVGRDLFVEYNLNNFVRSNAIFWESTQALVHNPEVQSKLWNILKPLKYEVWLLCILSCFLSAMATVLFSRYTPMSAWNLKLEIAIVDEISFLENLWTFVGAALMQGQDFYPFAISARVVLAIWWIFMLVMSNVYSADLTSFLTTSSEMKKMESFKQLMTTPNMMYYTPTNSKFHQILKYSNDSTYRNLLEKIKFTNGINSCIKWALNNKNTACISDSSPLIKVAYQNCSSVYLIDDYLEWQSINMIYSKEFTFKEKIDSEIKFMTQLGLLDKWFEKFWRTRGPFDKPCKQDLSSNKLTIIDIGGAFILTGILFGLGMIILGMEVLITEYLSRRGRKWSPNQAAASQRSLHYT